MANNLTNKCFTTIGLLLCLCCCTTPFEDQYTEFGGLSKPAHGAQSPGAVPICPDKPSTRLYNLDAKGNWVPTPCEARIVKAAMDYCFKQTTKTDKLENMLLRLEDIGSSTVALSAAATGIAGIAVGSAPVALAGTATLVTNLSGDLGKLFSGSPPALPAVTSMMTAATSYAQTNQDVIVPPDQQGQNNPYYAGLWNAVGSACPTNLLAGSFKLADFDNAQMDVASWSAQSTSISYPIADKDTPDAVFGKILAALQGNVMLAKSFDIQPGNVSHSVTLTPTAKSTPATLTATIVDSTGKTSSAEVATISTGANSITTLTIGGIAKAGDTVTIASTWYAAP